GVIEVPGRGAEGIGRRLAAEVPAAAGQLAGTVRRLADDGASDHLVDLFLEAARAATAGLGRAGPGGEDGPARSAAERFLFERLESLPETAGLFALNAALEFPFGPDRKSTRLNSS